MFADGRLHGSQRPASKLLRVGASRCSPYTLLVLEMTVPDHLDQGSERERLISGSVEWLARCVSACRLMQKLGACTG